MKTIIIFLAILTRTVAVEADVNLRFFSSVEAKNFSEVARTINAGVDPNSLDGRGRSALWIARWSHSVDSFAFLLSCGADPNWPATKSGNTILAEMTGEDALQFLKLFLEFGGDINSNIKNAAGEYESFLFRAIRLSQIDVIRFVIRHGAKTDERDSSGRTPLRVAVDARRYQVGYNLLQLNAIVPAVDLAPGSFAEIYKDPAEKLGPLSEYWRAKLIERLAVAKADFQRKQKEKR